MTGAQALIESLKREQVAHIFGYAGATICPAVDALKSHPEIGYTLVRTEQNAGHMASGYARVSGKVGVCMVTSGPGATNLITGIATAYMDSIPMVAITGQVPSNLLGRDIFQEVDITGAVAPFSKHSYLVKDANDIPRIVKEAFHIASTGRPGPVLIDIPIDVQEQSLKKFYYPEEVSIRGYKPSVKGNDLQIKRVAEAISKSRQPVICAGGGVWLADAKEELLELAAEYPDVEVEVIPGLTAALSGAAVLGAPLAHDFCVISLSDRLTPWEMIEKRLACAAMGDFCVALYNPSSKGRPDYLQKAVRILLQNGKGAGTLCGVIRSIGRTGQQSSQMTLAELEHTTVDMFTTVFIGNSATHQVSGWMVTPRGYHGV